MISSFIVTLIECLEIAFITLLISQTNVGKLRISLYAILGLVGGLFSALYLHEVLENYEWSMYGLLSIMFFYLFFKSKDLVSHIKQHVNTMSTQASPIMIFLAMFLIYGRESMEIFSNLFLNPNSSWIAAGLAATTAVGIYQFARGSNWKIYIFKYGYIAYLGFGLWFGYEALEHLHIF